MTRPRARTAVVTGGSSGIGAAICATLTAEGVRVFNADLEPPADGERAAEHVVCDIRSDADVAALFDHVKNRVGALDILVNNAGGAGSPNGIDAITSAEWDASLDLLLGGPRRMMTAALPLLRVADRGAIVNIASICGQQPGWGGLAYSIAKGALIHLTRMAAAELAADGIRVNAVSPGFIATPIFGRSRGYDPEARVELAEAIRAEAGSAQPLLQAGEPDDVAAAVQYLASAEARFVTGHNLCVDGGLSLAPAHMWDPATVSPVLRAVAAGQRRIDTLRESAPERLTK